MADSAEELRRDKEQLDGLFELSLDAVILTDDDFHVLRVNKEFTRVFGYTADEAAGRRLQDLIVPEELHAESVKNRALLVSGKRIELRPFGKAKEVFALMFPYGVPANYRASGFQPHC